MEILVSDIYYVKVGSFLNSLQIKTLRATTLHWAFFTNVIADAQGDYLISPFSSTLKFSMTCTAT